MQLSKYHLVITRKCAIQFRTIKFILLGTVLLGIILAAIIQTLEYLSQTPGKGYENRHYTECIEILAADENCLEPTLNTNDNFTNKPQDFDAPNQNLNVFIKEKRGLNAQEGMWRATNMIVIFTLMQVILGIVGLTIIARTLVQTNAVLRETRNATKQARLATDAANRTADESRNATEIELQPYLTIEGWDAKVCKEGVREFELDITFTIKNSGKTPAYDLRITHWASICQLSVADWAYCIHHRVSGGDLQILGSERTEDVVLRVSCHMNKGPGRAPLIQEGSVIERIELPETKFSYKDSFVIQTNQHKFFMAQVYWTRDRDGVPGSMNIVSRPQKQSDDKSELYSEYKDYKPMH